VLCERESEGNALQLDMHGSHEHDAEAKRKRHVDDQYDQSDNETRNLQKRPRLDYRHLQKSFPDEEESEEQILTSVEIIYPTFAETLLSNDDPKSLSKAKCSLEWPEWEKAIGIELVQLHEMDTWQLEEKPPDVIPIMNKWVLTQKYNKAGEPVKYKARLITKGYAQ